jgi:bis(5'-nucleosyl)-tetraphosphatase (symmetrical)
MATYAVGDVQGCFSALQKLVAQIRFDPTADRLLFVGDLVNRGPHSLAVLRYVKNLGPAAVTVLGNHDLHVLAVAAGIHRPRAKDTIQDILTAPDREELLGWLRRQPFLHREQHSVLVHAGLLPQWNVDEAEQLAREVEHALRSDGYRDLLRSFYDRTRCRWSQDLTGPARLSVTARALTRLRVCTTDGDMEFEFTGPPEQAPKGYVPWFEVPGRKSADVTIICGHWAALGLQIQDNLLALDGGCVWGRELVAIRLNDRQLYRVSCGG